tara:strand:- start:422 stop:1642 length:1221 start_codon:yes stop_codon:yes gene_type:complete
VTARLILGDCLDALRSMPTASVDAIICDPPAGIAFMGRGWDSDKGGRDQWVAWLSEVMGEALRVVKPGGHALVWALPRTSHWTGWALESAGWVVRDRIGHQFYSGFPKSLDVSKAIDRRRDDAAAVRTVCRFLRGCIDKHPTETTKTVAERFGFHPRMVDHWAARDTDSQPTLPTWEQWVALKAALGIDADVDADVWRLNGRKGKPGEAWDERGSTGVSGERGGFSGVRLGTAGNPTRDIPATPEAAAWSGWGTALKPAQEDWYLCRAPLSEKTVAANVLRWGVGAIHVDACRYAYGDPAWPGPGGRNDPVPVINGSPIPRTAYGAFAGDAGAAMSFGTTHALGRWPANIYACPKPSRRERERGCEQLPAMAGHEAVDRQEGSAGVSNPRAGAGRTADAVRNAHPT